MYKRPYQIRLKTKPYETFLFGMTLDDDFPMRPPFLVGLSHLLQLQHLFLEHLKGCVFQLQQLPELLWRCGQAWWTGLRRLPDPNGDCQWYIPNLYTAVCSWKNNTQVMLASNLNALGHDKWTNNHNKSFTIDPPFGGLDYIPRFQRSKPNL